MRFPATWRHGLRSGLLLAAAAALPIACGRSRASELRVRRIYLVTPAPAAPAAMYFVIDNDGVWADTLLSISTPAAAKTELHENVAMPATADSAAHAAMSPAAASPSRPPAPSLSPTSPPAGTGMMTMARASLVILPAHSVTPFAPGGRHAMLTTLHEGLKRGDTVGVTFVFMRRGELRARAAVISYADVDTATAQPPAEP